MASLPDPSNPEGLNRPSDPEFYRSLLDQMSDGVYFVDRNRRILYWNQGACRLTGYSVDEMLGKFCQNDILCHVNDTGSRLCQDGCPLSACIVDGNFHEDRVFLRHKEGHRVPVDIRVQPLRDSKGAIIGAIEIFSDASAQTDAERKVDSMRKLAFLDHLTRHPNRRFMEMTLDSALREFRVHKDSPGILLIDLDEFKAINDKYGHSCGDRALQQVALTLSGALRPTDIVGRWGGDEFLAIVYGADRSGVAQLAERCIAQVNATSVPVNGQERVQLSVSIGAVVARPGESAEEILGRADKLLYVSKARGRRRATVDQ